MAKTERSLMLIILCVLPFLSVSGEEKRETAPSFTPFVPVFNAGEVLSYNVYWKGLKVGYMKFRCGPRPEKGEAGALTFVSKSNRLGKWFFRFFYSQYTSKQDLSCGASLGFSRHIVRDDRFLEEDVTFDYRRMMLHQYIRHDRHARKVRRDRLIDSKMLDPLLVLYHMRAVAIEKKGEKRKFHLFADGFWDAEMEVAGRGRRDFGAAGEREYWTVALTVPRPWICFQAGRYLLETDRETGIILEMRWKSGKGTCKAVLTDAANSPLNMNARAGRAEER